LLDVVSNTSPLQYLHQVGRLDLLPKLASRVIVPPAVVSELSAGRIKGVNLPDPQNLDWITIRQPTSAPALPLVTDLGPGETEVLALALESRDSVALLDDALARSVARTLGLRVRGTLGILLDAKRAGLLQAVAPVLDELDALGFRLDPGTRVVVLRMAGEDEEAC
jgi:predicted nucleic acid-binding protein